MGDVYGGQWKPNPDKPNDMIFVGEPNTIKESFVPTRRGGYAVKVKYGADGWAVIIRYMTDHGPTGHSNPHDHIIAYDPHDHHPLWSESEAVNYWEDVPELKMRRGIKMENNNFDNGYTEYDLAKIEEANRFKTKWEFIRAMECGAEVNVEWKGVDYGIFNLPSRAPEHDGKAFFIGRMYDRSKDAYYMTAEGLLDYIIEGDRLGDVLTQLVVIDRTL